MKAKELANLLNGNSYDTEFSRYIINKASENNLIIVYGCTDNIVTVEGALSKRFEVYKEYFIKVGITAKGIKCYSECNQHEIVEYNVPIVNIRAIWCPSEETLLSNITNLTDEELYKVKWFIDIDIPHEKFKTYDDCGIYSTGIVFHVDDLKNYINNNNINNNNINKDNILNLDIELTNEVKHYYLSKLFDFKVDDNGIRYGYTGGKWLYPTYKVNFKHNLTTLRGIFDYYAFVKNKEHTKVKTTKNKK
jgi:hypothetical protein